MEGDKGREWRQSHERVGVDVAASGAAPAAIIAAPTAATKSS